MEVQDILKKLFGANENPRVSPPEEYQMQSHLTSPPSFPSQPSIPFTNTSIYSPQLRMPPPPTAVINGPQPYNSSLAFMQGNRRNLPPLQTPDRCFSSSNNKTNKPPPNRSYSCSSSSTNNNGIMPLLANPPVVSSPLSAPPLMKVNPSFPFSSATPTPLVTIPPRWTPNNEPQRGLHPFWCATCALGFPHQVAYQEHLRSHVSVGH